MKNASLVAFYGPKNSEKLKPLSNLILNCQKRITEKIGDKFVPYSLEQVHCTILGLDRDVTTNRLLNKRFVNRILDEHTELDKLPEMDFSGLITWLRNSRYLPITVQFGGFNTQTHSFLSNGKTPYERSFSVQNSTNFNEFLAVLIGWPVSQSTNDGFQSYANEKYPASLNNMRMDSKEFNIIHEYHRKPSDVDNDLFMRLGIVNAIKPSEINDLQFTIREYLANQSPVYFNLSLEDISFVGFEKSTLPWGKCNQLMVIDDNLTSSWIRSQYDIKEN